MTLSKIELLKYYLNKKGIPTSNINDLNKRGLITEKAIVKFLVQQEYNERKKRKNHYIMQSELAKKYNVSIATIQNYIYFKD